MSDHEYAVCPVCEEQQVTVQTLPQLPCRMYCLECGWASLDDVKVVR